ncbi:MAG: hypothetical protein K5650_01895 [Bacteroidales bacterium]|nr:hypothetical protein [Bacteroidales bacterium]
MSEVKNYTVKVNIDYTGFDEAKYTIVQADTILYLNLDLNGYTALRDLIIGRQAKASINVKTFYGGKSSIEVKSVVDTIALQLGYRLMSPPTSAKDSLRIVLKPMASKRIKPSIVGLDFSFAEQIGLAGTPSISPDSVTLYGSEQSLSQINRLEVEPLQIGNISANSTFKVKLKPTWLEYQDLKPDVEEIYVTIPVEPYTEKKLTIPVEVSGADSETNIKLYPSNVDIIVWVPQGSYSKYTESDYRAEVDFNDIEQEQPVLKVRLSSFPANSRIKRISPSEIQYILIK